MKTTKLLLIAIVLSVNLLLAQNNNCVKINGTLSEYVDIGNHYKYTHHFTTEMWVFKDNWSVISNEVILSCTESGGYNIAIIENGSSDEIKFSYRNYENTGYHTISYPVSGMVEGWHHIAVSFLTDEARLYVDGIYTIGAGSQISYNANNHLLLGAEVNGDSTAVGSFFNGYIDEIRFWDNSLSESNINHWKHKELTATQKPSYIENLKGYYKLDETWSEGWLDDASGNLSSYGNDYDLTNYNALSWEQKIPVVLFPEGYTDYSSEGESLWNATGTNWSRESKGLSLQDYGSLSLSTGEFYTYANNELTDTTRIDCPSDIELRASSIWFIDDNADDAINLCFDLSDFGAESIVDTNFVTPQYKLLYRSGNSGDFNVVSSASSLADGEIIFENYTPPADGYFTIGRIGYQAGYITEPKVIWNSTGLEWGEESTGLALQDYDIHSIVNNEYYGYVNNGIIGTTTNDCPSEIGSRSSTIWFIDDNADDTINFCFDLSDFGAEELEYSWLPPVNYKLLLRSGISGDFTVISSADSIANGEILFENHLPISDGYYAVGVKAFPIDYTDDPQGIWEGSGIEWGEESTGLALQDYDIQSIIGDEYYGYTNNGLTGITTTDCPSEVGLRSSTIWYIDDNADDAVNLRFYPGNFGAESIYDTNFVCLQYKLLKRTTTSGDFIDVSAAKLINNGEIIFENYTPEEGYYSLGRYTYPENYNNSPRNLSNLHGTEWSYESTGLSMQDYGSQSIEVNEFYGFANNGLTGTTINDLPDGISLRSSTVWFREKQSDDNVNLKFDLSDFNGEALVESGSVPEQYRLLYKNGPTSSYNLSIGHASSVSNGEIIFNNIHLNQSYFAIGKVNKTIISSLDGASSVYATDIDGDGDMDILGTGFFADDIIWWEKDESGYSEHIIDSDFDGANSVYATDIDGDGDIDVLGASSYDGIILWENDGNQIFKKDTIDINFDGVSSVYAKDIDGDGNIDILGAAYSIHDIAWWKNDGNNNFIKYVVDDNCYNPRAIYATDLDRDGNMDILSASSMSSEILWWRNDGNENFTKIVVGYCNYVSSLYAADVDIDGDMDLFTALYDDEGAGKIYWYENDGSENFTQNSINSSGEEFDGATSVYATDVNGDGYMDILGAAEDEDEIAWWENNGSESFTKRVMDSEFFGASSVYATDLDNDGDIDILGAAKLLDEIAYWEQEETPTKTTIFTDGSSFLSSVINDQENQPIGRFQLTSTEIFSLLIVEIKLNGIRTGHSDFRLWQSADAVFDSTDIQLGCMVEFDPGDAKTIVFDREYASPINTSGTYYFLTCDIASDATGSIQPVLVNDASLKFSGGTLNGTINNSPLASSLVPQNIVTAINGADIQVSWDVVVGATSYKVYSSDDPYGTFVEATGTFDGLSWSQPYAESKKFYFVVAVTGAK